MNNFFPKLLRVILSSTKILFILGIPIWIIILFHIIMPFLERAETKNNMTNVINSYEAEMNVENSKITINNVDEQRFHFTHYIFNYEDKYKNNYDYCADVINFLNIAMIEIKFMKKNIQS